MQAGFELWDSPSYTSNNYCRIFHCEGMLLFIQQLLIWSPLGDLHFIIY
jgi:hypothetical protein